MKLLIFSLQSNLINAQHNKIIWRIRGSNPDPFDIGSNTNHNAATIRVIIVYLKHNEPTFKLTMVCLL